MVDSEQRIAIACDHAGYQEKEYLKSKLTEMGYSLMDFGTYSPDSVDYPDVVHPLALAVQSGEYSRGILLCGSGNGVAMVANKYAGIRAALCWTDEITKLSRTHNDANVLALPARFISKTDALTFSLTFLSTAFEGGRHSRRVDKINKLMQ